MNALPVRASLAISLFAIFAALNASAQFRFPKNSTRPGGKFTLPPIANAGEEADSYFRAMYGPPAKDGTAPAGKLLTLTPSRWLVYPAQRVRIVLRPVGPVRDGHEPREWAVAYFTDPLTRRWLSPVEAAFRLMPLTRFSSSTEAGDNNPYGLIPPFRGVPVRTADERAVKAAAAAVEAKRRAAAEAAEAAIPAEPTRANYDRVKVGMSIEKVQAILGPGKEAARSPGFLVATWQRDNGLLQPRTIISVTFQNGRMLSKAIAGP
jgi:hypothetical protein